MIVNKKNMLEDNSRCEEWNDTRTIKFMNTPPYKKKGEKTIQNFIDSVGVCDITYDEIFWVVINNHLTKENKIDFCINRLNIYALILNVDFTFSLFTLRYIQSNLNISSTEIVGLLALCDTVLTTELEVFNDVTDKYRLYKLLKQFLTSIQSNSDMALITQKICKSLIDFYPDSNDYTVLSTLNNIVSLYE